MRTKRPTEDKTIRYVSGWDVTAAVGITCMQLIENIQYADGIRTNESLVDLSKQLDNAIHMQAQFCMENQRLLKLIMVELPPNLAAIKVKNPLYDEEAAKRYSDEQRFTSDGFGDNPF